MDNRYIYHYHDMLLINISVVSINILFSDSPPIYHTREFYCWLNPFCLPYILFSRTLTVVGMVMQACESAPGASMLPETNEVVHDHCV